MKYYYVFKCIKSKEFGVINIENESVVISPHKVYNVMMKLEDKKTYGQHNLRTCR